MQTQEKVLGADIAPIDPTRAAEQLADAALIEQRFDERGSWLMVQPFDDITYWFRGIYKITSYRAGEFHSYYMPDHYLNWGDHPSPPPDNGKYDRCWSSLESAQAACDAHAMKHSPKPRTVKRAAEIKAALLSSGSGVNR